MPIIQAPGGSADDLTDMSTSSEETDEIRIPWSPFDEAISGSDSDEPRKPWYDIDFDATKQHQMERWYGLKAIPPPTLDRFMQLLLAVGDVQDSRLDWPNLIEKACTKYIKELAIYLHRDPSTLRDFNRLAAAYRKLCAHLFQEKKHSVCPPLDAIDNACYPRQLSYSNIPVHLHRLVQWSEGLSRSKYSWSTLFNDVQLRLCGGDHDRACEYWELYTEQLGVALAAQGRSSRLTQRLKNALDAMIIFKKDIDFRAEAK
ncbi:hypothetical protein PG984_009854 [Apiospora sp. TS-2023a]